MAASLSELRAIFCDALDFETATERASFLDRACRGDPELRIEIETLLAAHAEAGELPPDAVEETKDEIGEASATSHAGARVGAYRLIEKIGEGGFGLVFLAEQHQPFQRQVAIKILKQGMDNRQVIARFEAESQALALMEHPNIAHVFDSGITTEESGELGSGRPYFVMELCRGIPITDYCAKHAVPLKDRLELFISICLAVQHAHLKGIIHRDLKPSNVLVIMHDNQPVVKLIDFGIAKATGGQQLIDKTSCTTIAQFIGTPLYMSPEQTKTGSLDVDTRTDIYSLGVLLYELLTGTTPFDVGRLREAGFDEMRRIIREEDPPPPSRRLGPGGTQRSELEKKDAAHLPSSFKLHPSSLQELDWIVMKALEKDRSRRYLTASALASDVRRYLQNEPVQACPPSRWYRFSKLAKRNKGAIVAAALVLLALVTGTVASVWQALRATAAANSESQALQNLGEELERTKQAEEKATRELFEALVAEARANRLSRRMGQRFATLDILRRAAGIARQLQLPEERFRELRNEALAAMALTDVKVDRVLTGPNRFSGTAFDSRLKRYAHLESDGMLHVRRLEDGRSIRQLPGAEDVDPKFSPDGRFLAMKIPLNKFVVWDLGSSEPSQGVSEPPILPVKVFDEDNGVHVAFNPDSRQAAFCDLEGLVTIYDLMSRTKIRSRKFVGPVFCEFDPRGRLLAIIARQDPITPVESGPRIFPRRILQVLDLQSNNVLWEQTVSCLRPSLSWHPDGKTFALCYAHSDGDAISLWDATTGVQKGSMDCEGGGGLACTFNPSGTLLASNGWVPTLRIWDPLTSRLLLSTLGIRGGQFSPDGRFLVTEEDDRTIRVLEIAVGSEYRTLTANPLAGKKRYQDASISSDGRWLAGGADGGIGYWDLSNGKNQFFLESPGSHFVFIEPSGSLLSQGQEGLLRRPILTDPATGSMVLGKPEQKLPVRGATSMFSQSADRKVLAACQANGPVVMLADRSGQVIPLGTDKDVRRLAVSPDGRWVATGGYGSPGNAMIWEVPKSIEAQRPDEPQKCKLVKELKVGAFCRVVFSPDPDRKLLFTSIENGPIRAWQVGTWEEVVYPTPMHGPCFALSPDGKLLVAETGSGVACLYDARTGKEYAQLEDPNQHTTSHFTFSQDCTTLICTSVNGCCLHVWDLQALRRQLEEMDLNWHD